MKITEINAGDYVYNEDNELCKVCVVNMLTNIVIVDNYEHDNAYDNGTLYEYSIDDIKPIPITTEILEKNKFDKDPYGEGYAHSYDNYDVSLTPVKANTWYLFISAKTFVKMNHESCYVCSIHEMQHFMRQCGIDNEIVI